MLLFEKIYFYITNVLQNSIATIRDKLRFTNLRYILNSPKPNPQIRYDWEEDKLYSIPRLVSCTFQGFKKRFYIRFQTRFEIKAPKPNPKIRYELRRRQIVFNPQVGVVHISRLSLMLITQSAKAIQATQILQLLLCKLVSLHFDNYQAFVNQD